MRTHRLSWSKRLPITNQKKNRHRPKAFFWRGCFLFLGAFFLAISLTLNPLAIVDGPPGFLFELKAVLADCGAATSTASLTPSGASQSHNMSGMPGMDMGSMPGMDMSGMSGMDNMNMGDMGNMDMGSMPAMAGTTSCVTTASASAAPTNNMVANMYNTMPTTSHTHGATIIPPTEDTKTIVLAGFAGANGLVIVMAAIARKKHAKKPQAKIIRRRESR